MNMALLSDEGEICTYMHHLGKISEKSMVKRARQDRARLVLEQINQPTSHWSIRSLKFGALHEVSVPLILAKVPIIFRYVAGEAEAPFPADPMKECSVPFWRPAL